MRRAWTAALTTPMRDGKGAACGRRAVIGRRGSRKAARVPFRSPSISEEEGHVDGFQQAEPIKRLVSGCRQVIAARNTYSRAKSAHLRTQKIAEQVVAARDQRPPARACGSWPANR